MARYCAHTFVCIKTINIDEFTNGFGGVIPAIVACVYCGQIRHIYSDGLVKIAVDEGKIEKKI